MGSTATNQEPSLPRLIDCTAVAELLGVEVRHIRRLVHERRIPFVKWSHLVRFDPVEVLAWIDQSRVPPTRRP